MNKRNYLEQVFREVLEDDIEEDGYIGHFFYRPHYGWYYEFPEPRHWGDIGEPLGYTVEEAEKTIRFLWG